MMTSPKSARLRKESKLTYSTWMMKRKKRNSKALSADVVIIKPMSAHL